MRCVLLLFCIAVALMSSGCGVNGSDPDGLEIRPLDGKLHLVASANHYYPRPGEPEGTTHIALRTKKIYGCANVAIVTKFERAGDAFLIDIIGLQDPDPCLTALGPAGVVHTALLEPGTYKLYLTYRPPGQRVPSRDEYRIIVPENGAEEFEAVETSFSEPVWDFVPTD